MKPSAILIVLVSVLLSVGMSYLLGATGAVDARVAPAASTDPCGHLALEQRVREIERRMDDLEPSLVAPEVPAEPAAPAPVRTALTKDAEAPAASDSRLAALERRLANIELMLGGPQLAALSDGVDQALRREEEIRAAKTVLADPGATSRGKLAAHEALRRETDAYTTQMVQDLAYLGAHDPDPVVRAGIWRNFDGATLLPELVPHLLHALSGDGDPRVRDEAAETLGNYADDPAVLGSLKFAAENDESIHVRRKASRALVEWNGIETGR